MKDYIIAINGRVNLGFISVHYFNSKNEAIEYFNNYINYFNDMQLMCGKINSFGSKTYEILIKTKLKRS